MNQVHTVTRLKLRRTSELIVRRSEDNTLPYVGLENVESKTGRYLEGIDEKPDAVANEFGPGDVLFGKLRPYLSKSLAPNFHGRCSGELLVLRPKSLEAKFLHYWLLSDETISAVSASTYGAKMPRADWDFIGNLEIPIPPLPVQRRIAAYLDRETARIDALVAEKETLLKLLEEKRASLISQAVTRGLDPKAKLKPSGIPWLGDVPEHWEVKELRYLVDPKRQVMYGIVLPGPHVETGVPIIKGGDVRPHRLNPDTLSRTTHEIAASHSRSMVRSGDILFSIRGSIGDVALVPESLDGANITQDAARIAPRSGVDRDWLFWALKSDYAYSSLEIGSLGAAVRGINIRDLKRLWLAVPTFHEQRAIGTFLTTQIENSIGLEADIKSSIALLREKRVSLISSAVTGEMAPPQ